MTGVGNNARLAVSAMHVVRPQHLHSCAPAVSTCATALLAKLEFVRGAALMKLVLEYVLHTRKNDRGSQFPESSRKKSLLSEKPHDRRKGGNVNVSAMNVASKVNSQGMIEHGVDERSPRGRLISLRSVSSRQRVRD